MFELYDDIMTVEDVMNALKLGKNSVYELLSSGRLTGFKEGRIWKAEVSSILLTSDFMMQKK